MARLPDTPSGGLIAPRGEEASTVGVRPSTGGLDALAQGVDAVGDAAVKVGQVLQARDDRDAQKATQGLRAEWEAGFAARAQGPDAGQAGWAANELAAFDDHFKGAMQAAGGHRQAAIQKLLTQYRADVGERAIGAEAKARAGVVADQLRAKDDVAVSGAMGGYVAAFGPRYQALVDGYDGSQAGFADQVRDAHAEVAQQVLDQAPERLRPQLEARLANQGLTAFANAQAVEDKGHDAYVLQGAAKTADALANGVLSNPLGYDAARPELARTAAVLPKALQQKFLDDQGGLLAAARVQGLVRRGDLAQAKAELDDGRYDRVLTPQHKAALQASIEAEATQKAEALARSTAFGADVDPAAMLANAKIAGRDDLVAQAQFYAETGAATPAALDALAKGQQPGGLADLTSWLIGDVEGGGQLVPNDNGRGPTRFGISQAANPDVNVATLDEAGAAQVFRTRYWRAIHADQLQAPLRAAAFAAAANFGVKPTQEMLAASEYDTGRFLALNEQRYRELAAQPGQAGNLPAWLGRLAKVRAKAASLAAFENVQEGLSSDPIKFAMGGPNRRPLAVVTPLPQDVGPDFQAALKDRLSLGVGMQKSYGAPLRMLTDGEAAFWKSRLEQDPNVILPLAAAAEQAVGPAAARSLMGELGRQGNAGVELHLADLAAGGSTDFARRAVAGLGLGKGAEGLSTSETAALKTGFDSHAVVFTGQPELRAAAERAAEAALRADKQSGSAKPAAYYVQGALGGKAAGGRVYGGVTELNGRDTLIPGWLAADHADDALSVMAESWAATGRGPVYASGKPVAADKLRSARLQLRPDGRYQILDDRGVLAMTKDGRPFAFNWDDARAGLARRLGSGAVLPGGR